MVPGTSAFCSVSAAGIEPRVALMIIGFAETALLVRYTQFNSSLSYLIVNFNS